MDDINDVPLNQSNEKATLQEEPNPDEDVSEDWEYCFKFDNVEEPRDKDGNPITHGSSFEKWQKIQAERQSIVERLRNAGLKVKVVRVQAKGNKDKDFVLISASQERLEQEAERVELNMKLKIEYGGGYSEFEIEKKFMFRLNDPERGDLFRKGQKIQLLQTIMQLKVEEGGANVSFNQSLHSGVVNKIFPLHEPAKVKWLMTNWASFKNTFKPQPIDKVRDYFGEEVAIYFAWLGFYTSWLWFATAVGSVVFIFWIGGLAAKTQPFWEQASNWSSAVYAVFLSIWATFFLEFWKRYQSKLTHNWGTMNYEEDEQERVEYSGIRREGLYFKGEWIIPWEKSAKDDKTAIEKDLQQTFDLEGGTAKEEFATVDIPPMYNIYYPDLYRFGKIGSAFPIIGVMLGVVVIASFSALTIRLITQRRVESIFGSIVGGIINAIVIMFFNGVWRKVADYLTNWENHRTYTSYQDQLIFKIFMFQFVNSYTSLYYMAFFKNYNHLWFSNQMDLIDSCGVGSVSLSPIIGHGCVYQLSIQLMALLAVSITVNQVREILVPWMMSKIKLHFYERATGEGEDEKHDLHPSQYEKESNLVDYPGTFDEYNEMVIQFGLVTLFATSFPLAPIFAVLNNMFEIRTDAIKFMTGYNRPNYRGAQDIGTWYLILEVLGVVAVITNCLLIGFSYPTVSSLFPDRDPYRTLAVVIILEHILLATKYIIAVLIPDVPAKIRRDIAKQEWIKEYSYKKEMNRIKKLKLDKKENN